MATKKTAKMRAAEEVIYMPLENYLPETLTEIGITATAGRLGVSKATLGYWLLKLNIRVERVALGPGDSYRVTRARPR